MHTTPPLSSEPLRFKMPQVSTHVFSNGTHLHVITDELQDLITASVMMRTGARCDVVRGETSIAAQMLTRGTKRYSAAEFAEEVESRGCSVRSSADADTASVRGSGLVEWFPQIVELMADAIMNPVFDERELSILKSRLLADIQVDMVDVDWLALRACAQGAFQGHPYGMPRNGTPRTLPNVTPDVLRSAHQRMLVAERHVIVAGPLTMDRVLPVIEAAFAELPHTGHAAPTAQIMLRPRAGVVAVKNDAVQSAIRIALPCPQHKHIHDASVQLLTNVLGGHSLARLFAVLREQKGYTYGAYAFNDVRPFGATTGIITSVGNNFTSDTVATIAEILDDMNQQTIHDDELEISRQHLLGSFARANETPQQTAALLWSTILHELPPTYFEDLVTTVQSIQAEDLMVAQRQWFDRSAWVLGIAGVEDIATAAIEPWVDSIEHWNSEEYQ